MHVIDATGTESVCGVNTIDLFSSVSVVQYYSLDANDLRMLSAALRDGLTATPHALPAGPLEAPAMLHPTSRVTKLQRSASVSRTFSAWGSRLFPRRASGSEDARGGSTPQPRGGVHVQVASSANLPVATVIGLFPPIEARGSAAVHRGLGPKADPFG